MSNRQIFKIVIKGSDIIQGLISIEVIESEKYIEMHLIENAYHNMGIHKKYRDVAAVLIAYISRMSIDFGFGGVVSFKAKSQLVDYYRNTFGAQVVFGSQRMAIFTAQAKKIINSYLKTMPNDK